MQARPAAAGLTHDAAQDEPGSARVAEARNRARERRDAQRQALRPLGVLYIAVVVTVSAQTRPAPGLHGAGLGCSSRSRCTPRRSQPPSASAGPAAARWHRPG